jgi:glucuronate isomerase
LARFLDRLDRTDQLSKTIIYNLNPRDNELFASMIGNFQDGSVPGKMQSRRVGQSCYCDWLRALGLD